MHWTNKGQAKVMTETIFHITFQGSKVFPINHPMSKELKEYGVLKMKGLFSCLRPSSIYVVRQLYLSKYGSFSKWTS